MGSPLWLLGAARCSLSSGPLLEQRPRGLRCYILVLHNVALMPHTRTLCVACCLKWARCSVRY
jgi:hypothetical protein